jgi:hypothetical protein
MKNKLKQSRLRKKIEHLKTIKQDSSLDNSPEDFIPGLLQEIKNKASALPEIDISTPEMAAKTAVELEKHLELLTNLQSRASGLKSLLEQKKFTLT